MEKRKNFKISIESDSLSEQESNSILKQLAVSASEIKLSPQVSKNKETGIHYINGSIYILDNTDYTDFPPVGSWVIFTGSKNKLEEFNSNRFLPARNMSCFNLDRIKAFQVLGNGEINNVKYVEVIRPWDVSNYSLAIPLKDVLMCSLSRLHNLGVWTPDIGNRVILKYSTKYISRNASGAKGDILNVNYQAYKAKIRWWRNSKWTYDEKNCDGVSEINFVHFYPE